MGVVRPLIWNPVPPIEDCEMSTAVPPVLVSVTDCAFLEPTVTEPNASPVGFNVN